MSRVVKAEIAFASLKSCLVNLPSNIIALLSNADTPVQNVVVELQYRTQTLSSNAVSSANAAGFQRSAYVGWTGMPSRSRAASIIPNERSRGSRETEIQTVEIDATFGKLLGLTEGMKIGLLCHLDPPVAHTVHIEPLTPADWEVIELHATFLELNLLSQIRALPNPSFTDKTTTQAQQNHPLTLHLSPTSTANIIVTSLAPPPPSTQPFAKVDPGAEVIVAPKERPRSSRNTRGDARSIASRRSGKSTRTTTSKKNATVRDPVFLRGLDLNVAKEFITPANHREVSGLTLWLGKDVISSESLRSTSFVGVSVVKPAGLRAHLEQNIIQQLKEEEGSEVGRPAGKIIARVLPWTNCLDNQHAVMSSALSAVLGVSNCSGLLLRVEAATQPLPRSSLKGFSLFPFLASSSKKREGLKFGGDSKVVKQALVDRLRITHGGDDGLLAGPLTDGMVLLPRIESASSTSFDGGILRFSAPQDEAVDIDKHCLWVIGGEQKQEFEVRDEIPRPVELTTLFPTFAHGIPSELPDLIGIDKVIKQCMSNLTLCSSVLLTGGIGSGKTALSQVLGHQLREDYVFNVVYFSCQKLVTDETRVSSIKDTLTKLFMSASWCARLGGQSLVILDDLDKICPVETELQVGNDNGRSRQVTEILCAVVRQYCSIQSGVTMLATAQSKDALNSIIIGGHIVGDIISLKAPTKAIRRDMLHQLTATLPQINQDSSQGQLPNVSDSRSLTESSWMNPSNPSSRPGSSASSHTDGFRISPSLDLLDIAGRTDGYMPADLALLVSRARNESLIRTFSVSTVENANQARLLLTRADFDAALRNFVPSSLRNVTLTHSSTTFSSVGGLHSTRNTLLETLLYPTKYAPIFARSPLRLRSGLLLYGYPGCGKTLLASAVAGECNLNFISVKGPEILNKYIGASEKSVRDLFERAQAAKPCVLFFDEFDSIAPKRGHDSTGVTDRVVNQMLTQMDGAEGLDGVYVLAATSRPDLIDPALLRPGRLDKSLLCDMPDASDRKDILSAVSEKLHLTPDVSGRLSDIAGRTEGFSGADLQALMYNAHLEAIHDLLGDKTSTSKQAPHPASNGTKPPSAAGKTNGRRSSTPSTTTNKQHDFIQFLYGSDGDGDDPTAKPQTAALDPRAAIAAKLDEIRLGRKRDKAQLRRAHQQHRQERTTDGDVATATEKVTIEWRHVQRALGTTRSSISQQERRRLRAIYDEFVQGRNGEMPNGGEGNRDVGGRTSLM